MSTNSDYSWDAFDPDAYVSHNYLTLRDDDAEILAAVGDFFASAGVSDARGVDVGSGANLYPALAMLPFCKEITQWEFSKGNLRWLQDQRASYEPNWDVFWELLVSRAKEYEAIARPRVLFSERVNPVEGSVFDLPTQEWGLGTMFFVAESLTGEMDEFDRATRCFVGALSVGAPFAIAFMEHSKGYPVGDREFPAVDIGVPEVRSVLEDCSTELEIQRFDSRGLRDGYGGMILATGRSAVR